MKKDVAYYMSLKYRMEILQDEEGFTVRFPDLPGCLTCGETIEEALKNAEYAKKCWFTAAIKDCRERIKEPDDVSQGCQD